MRVTLYAGTVLLFVGCSSSGVRQPPDAAPQPAIAMAASAADVAECGNVEDCDVPEVRALVSEPSRALLQDESEAGRGRIVASSAAAEDAHAGPVTSTSKLMAAHFIDVGQGSATLLEFPCAAVLIDTGGEEGDDFSGKTNLSDYLDEFFTRRTDLSRRLDLVVLSHPHIDHTRGVAVLEEAANLTIRHVIDNGEEHRGSGKDEQLKLRTLTSSHEAILEPDITSLDGKTSPVIDPIACAEVDPRIRAVWGHLSARPDMDGDGRSDWSETEWRNENNHSVVLRVDFGDSSFLFPGDIQRAASDSIAESYEADTSILDVDLVNVPHHGSENGITKNLLKLVSPRIAVIQAGDSSRDAEYTAFGHGHPRKKIMELLTASTAAGGVSGTRNLVTVPVATAKRTFEPFALDKAIFSTSWDGTIIVYANTNGQMQVVTESDE